MSTNSASYSTSLNKTSVTEANTPVQGNTASPTVVISGNTQKGKKSKSTTNVSISQTDHGSVKGSLDLAGQSVAAAFGGLESSTEQIIDYAESALYTDLANKANNLEFVSDLTLGLFDAQVKTNDSVRQSIESGLTAASDAQTNDKTKLILIAAAAIVGIIYAPEIMKSFK